MRTTQDGVTTRLLPAHGASPALELLEVRSKRDSCPPTICVHGAFGGAWMWEEFLRIMAERGHHAAAVSVRGHGMSEGRHALRSATLAHYVADVFRALAEFSEPPVIIAHSLGALVAQRLLGRTAIRALVMLAPLPPEGMLLINGRLMVTAPATWLGIAQAMFGFGTSVLGDLKDLIFSDRFAQADVDRHMTRMVVESMQVLLDAHVPMPTPPALSLGIPTLVIAGDADRLVPNEFARRTAIYHGAEFISASGFGHLLHLEPGADRVVKMTIGWLERRNLLF
jgi:pimeloyl-ACP methyl ester carboxylesterase